MFSLLLAVLAAPGAAIAAVDQLQNPAHSDEWRGHDGKDDHGRGGHGDGDHGRDGHDQRDQALALGEVAASAWDDRRTVGVQFELVNNAREAVKDVRVTSIVVQGGWYQGPARLPVLLGKVQAERSLLVDAVFRLAPINGSPHAFTLAGTYEKKGKTHKFKFEGVIRPTTAEPGPFAVVDGMSGKKSLRKAFFPPASRETGEFDAEVPVLIPLGPERQLFPLTPTGTGVNGNGNGNGNGPGLTSAADLVTIVRNTQTATTGSRPPDPNAAASSPDGVVLSTFNTGISFSTDGGATFTSIDLRSPEPGNPARTTFFPETDGGVCCDQIVVFIPGQNLFVWLVQYRPVLNAAGTMVVAQNRLRVAWASPQAIAADFYHAWTYADLTGANVPGVSSGLGVAANEWLDFPDLAWSDTFLYVSSSHGTSARKVFGGRRILARLRLDDIADTTRSTVRYNRTELTGASGLTKSRFLQGAPGRVVVGALADSSTLRVFTLADNVRSAVSSTVPISRIAREQSSYTSIAPDGTDWYMVTVPGNVSGGAFRRVPAQNPAGFRDEYLFAFASGVNPGAGRPRPYVRIETVAPPTSTATSYSAVSEYDVWNSDYAYAMAALGSDGREISINLAVGGGTIGFPQNAVGYLGDFVVYQVTNSNATQVNQYGDYLSNRLVPGSRRFFGAAVYDVILNPLPPGVPSGTCATVGCTARVRYVLYGRPLVVIP
jgi:hypothetical protein